MAAEGVSTRRDHARGQREPTSTRTFPRWWTGRLAGADGLCPTAKVAVLSNATRAGDPRVHAALKRVDDNILKLDTVHPDAIRHIDRPVGPYDVHQVVSTWASFGGHVIVQTIFLGGEVDGQPIDNTGERYVGPWLRALERIAPQAVTVYTIARETPYPGLRKAPRATLDAICQRVRDLGIPCSASY